MQRSKPKRKKITKLFKPCAAKMSHRTFAFIMDLILVMSFTTLLITKVVLPTQYPEELAKFEDLIIQQQERGNDFSEIQEEIKQLDPKVNQMLVEVQGLYLLAFWIYFAGTEIFMRGSSLGKKIFRIRVISLRTLETPSFFEVILRSGTKAITIQTLFPFLLLNYFMAYFTRQKQAGHDLLSRTLVVEETEYLEPITEEEQDSIKDTDEAEEFER